MIFLPKLNPMKDVLVSLSIVLFFSTILIVSAIFNGNSSQSTAIAAPNPAVQSQQAKISTEVQPTATLAANTLQEISQMSSEKTITTPSGLQYVDVVVGKGDSPVPGNTVVVHYTGKLTNGNVFDSSVERGKPFAFKIGVGQVIKGWDEGVMTMKVGGKRTLTIPPDLAYGKSGAGGVIPPDSTLIFDVELLEIK